MTQCAQLRRNHNLVAGLGCNREAAAGIVRRALLRVDDRSPFPDFEQLGRRPSAVGSDGVNVSLAADRFVAQTAGRIRHHADQQHALLQARYGARCVPRPSRWNRPDQVRRSWDRAGCGEYRRGGGILERDRRHRPSYSKRKSLCNERQVLDRKHETGLTRATLPVSVKTGRAVLLDDASAESLGPAEVVVITGIAGPAGDKTQRHISGVDHAMCGIAGM